MTQTQKQQQFMITSKPDQTDPRHAFYDLVIINPQGPCLYPDGFKDQLGEPGAEIGDIVVCTEGMFVKQIHTNYEPAIVTGTDIISLQPSGRTYYPIKLISAFCPKYGDITITLNTEDHFDYYSVPNPFLYTQRGDKILVQNTAPKDTPPKFKIIDNITANELRAKFLQEQQKMRAKLQKQQKQK